MRSGDWRRTVLLGRAAPAVAARTGAVVGVTGRNNSAVVTGGRKDSAMSARPAAPVPVPVPGLVVVVTPSRAARRTLLAVGDAASASFRSTPLDRVETGADAEGGLFGAVRIGQIFNIL